jgi:hypothetical protein
MAKIEMSITSTLPVRNGDTITSPPMAMSDAKSSQLAEAVAALNAGGSSPSVKTPTSKSVKIDELDSGYASKSTSQSSTPDSLERTFVEGRGVVGGTRAAWGLTRSKIKLTPFDKPIPKLTQNRFEDLRELYADSLNELTRGVHPCRGILMSLKVLGESESTAAPWIFIQCDKAIAPKVRRFFKQSHVESEFKPLHPNAYKPKFDIYVHDMPPILLYCSTQNEPPPPPPPYPIPDIIRDLIPDPNAIKVWCNRNAIISSGSLCGSRIDVSTIMGVRSATVGGLISVISEEGESQNLGLTAGHFLSEEQYTEHPEDEYEDYEDGFLGESQEFEFDLCSLDFHARTDSEGDDAQVHKLENFENVLGYVYKASQDDLQSQPNLDWALFTMDSALSSLPNIVKGHHITQTASEDSTDADTMEWKVVLQTAMNGLVSGILSKSWSYLSLAPGRSLVRTNALNLSDKKGQFFLNRCYSAY